MSSTADDDLVLEDVSPPPNVVVEDRDNESMPGEAHESDDAEENTDSAQVKEDDARAVDNTMDGVKMPKERQETGAAEESDDEDRISLEDCEEDEGEVIDDDDDKKEEGELEDGEISSDSEKETRRSGSKSDVCSHFLRGECTWGEACNFMHPKNVPPPLVCSKKPITERVTRPRGRGRRGEKFFQSASSSSSAASLTGWERALRQAKVMNERALKRKEEPDFEQKKLVLAPSDFIPPSDDTDSDDTRRRGRRRSSSNTKGRQRGVERERPLEHPRQRPFPLPIHHRPGMIPSLLDIRPPSPPRLRLLSYDMPPPSRFPPKSLGPQVIYPNGRPMPVRERDPPSRPAREDSTKRGIPLARERETEKRNSHADTERTSKRQRHGDCKEGGGGRERTLPLPSKRRSAHDEKPRDPWERKPAGGRGRTLADRSYKDSLSGRSPSASSDHSRRVTTLSGSGSSLEKAAPSSSLDTLETVAVSDEDSKKQSSSDNSSSSSSSSTSSASSRSNSPSLPARYRISVNDEVEMKKEAEKSELESDEDVEEEKEAGKMKRKEKKDQEERGKESERKGEESERTARERTSPRGSLKRAHSESVHSTDHSRKRIPSIGSGDHPRKSPRPRCVEVAAEQMHSPPGKKGRSRSPPEETRQERRKEQKRRPAQPPRDQHAEQRKQELRQQLREIEERLLAAKQRRGIS